MNHQPSKQWAYRIIELWDKREYPEKYEFAYLRACKEVGQDSFFTYHQSDEGKGQAIMHLYNEAKKGNRPARMALDRVIEYLKK